MSEWKPRQSDIDWTRNHFDSLNDGAIWGIPRNDSIWRIDKIARVLTCIHGAKDDLFDSMTIVCKVLKYTTAYTPEQLSPEFLTTYLSPVTLGADVFGTGKVAVITDRNKAPLKKFLWREITDADRASMLVSLAQLPAEMRWDERSAPQCDFCSDSKPIVIYGASKLTTGEVKDCWRWSACAYCHDAITRNDFDALEQRSVSKIAGAMGRHHSRKTILFAIKMSLMRFHKESIPA